MLQWLCNLGLAEGEKKRWSELMTPKGERGLILKSIKVDFKFVGAPNLVSCFSSIVFGMLTST